MWKDIDFLCCPLFNAFVVAKTPINTAFLYLLATTGDYDTIKDHKHIVDEYDYLLYCGPGDCVKENVYETITNLPIKGELHTARSKKIMNIPFYQYEENTIQNNQANT